LIAKRGEVFLVAIPGQSKPRPAVILTADWLGQYALDLSVVPITTVSRVNFPTRVELAAGEGGLNKTSWAKCDQVTTIPKSLLMSPAFGRVSAAKMEVVEHAVRLALGL
jgi:mRNA interferase MazF